MRTVLIYENSFNWFNPFFDAACIYEPIKHNYQLNAPFAQTEDTASSVMISKDGESTQSAESYNLEYQLPGFKKKNISVKVDNNQLIIKGRERKRGNFWNTGGEYASDSVFVKSILLTSDMDRENITARYNKGALTIKIPKLEAEADHRKIIVSGDTETRTEAPAIPPAISRFWEKTKAKLQKLLTK